MKPVLKLIVPLAALALLSACVAGSADSAHAAASGPISLLLLGLWHGFISPATLVLEIVNTFLPHVLPWHAHLYETHAESVAYDVGFYLGLGGGPVIVWRRWRR